MITVIDDVADLLERFRRYTREQWLLRGLIVLSGLVALVPLWVLIHAIVLAVPALAALLLTAILPRGHVATVFLGLVVIWALVAGTAPPWVYAIVALGCLGVHWAAGACAIGPSFAEVDRNVWRGLTMPAVWAVGGIVVAVVVASLAGLVTLPSSLVLVVLTFGILVVGAAIVLTPGRQSDTAPDERPQTDR